jgi:hypothetical protein
VGHKLSMECSHGNSEGVMLWERIGKIRIESAPTKIIKLITYTFVLSTEAKRKFTCCGKPMKRVRFVVAVRCKECGKEDVEMLHSPAALCLSCGRRFCLCHPGEEPPELTSEE